MIEKNQLKSCLDKGIKKSFLVWMDKNFENLDTIDIRELYDLKVNISKNKDFFLINYKNHLREKVKDLIEARESKSEIEKAKKEEEQELLKEREKIDKEYQNKLKQIKSNPTPNIDRITKTIKDFILMTLDNKTEKHSILITGRAGIGKTYLIKKVLRKMFNPEELTKIIKNGHITGLSYYNLIYDNPNAIFFFDDISGLSTESGIALIKQSTENEQKRFVCYSSTTGKLEGRIPYCFFEGKQIFVLNQISTSKTFQPIISRIRNIEFSPTYKEMLIMFYEIIKYRWKNIDLKQKIKIVEFIERNTSESTKTFDLRLLNDVIDVYVYCNGINQKFKDMCSKMIEIDKDKEVVLELMNGGLSVKEQVKEFKKKTDKSRATYFNIKKGLENERFI